MLLLDISEHSYGDLDACMKASGFGDTDKSLYRMDKCMVGLIECLRDDLPKEGPEGFTIQLAKDDAGTEWDDTWESLKGKRQPNKQEQG